MTDVQEPAVEGGEGAEAAVSETAEQLFDWNDLETIAADMQAKEPAPQEEGDLVSDAEDLDEGEDAEAPEDDAGEEDTEASDGDSDAEDEAEEEEGGDDEASEEEEEIDFQGRRKIFKAKSADGKVIEVPNDARFRFKEDGKFVTRTLQDLKDNLAGKVAWQARIAEANRSRKELDAEKMQFQADLKAVNDQVGKFYGEIQNNNLEGALAVLATMVNKTPSEFVGNFLRTVKESAGRYSALSDHDMENIILQLDNKHLKSTMETREKRAQREQTAHVLQEKKQQYMESFDLSHDILKEVYDALVEQDDNGLDKMTDEQILETVVLTAIDYRIDTNLRAAYQELGVEPDEADVAKLVRIINAADDSRGKDLELEDYVSFVQAQIDKAPGVVTGKKAKTLGRKVKTRKTKPKKVKQVEPEIGENDSIDDLWERLA